ncbi:MAG: preprotein translocase subunit SecY [Dehalococcoidia bacterium]|nr:preprotein translocase subunit SecY [Dehalococcoidia bacterium]
MWSAFSLPDIRAKLLFTLGILVVFRFVAHVPLPGIDVVAMKELLGKSQLLGMLDLFSGGAMRNYSVAMMGVYPYITALIVVQLLTPVIPRLNALSQEGEAGRNKIAKYTHWLAVPMAFLQGYGQLVILQRGGVIEGVGFSGPYALATITMLLTVTAGTMFCVWLGELIDERGVGNGISMIIFAGIVAGLPEMIGRGFITGGVNMPGLVGFVALAIATIVGIVIFTEAHRRIPVQYAKSTFRGGRMYRQAGSTHIPIRVNSAGMIPLIFGMAIMVFPGTVASYFVNSASTGGFAVWVQNVFNPSGPYGDGAPYWIMYFALVMGFTFFYTMVMFQQQNLAEMLQKQGGFVPGIRPGNTTHEYLNGVITRVTWAGALFLAVVAVVPFFTRAMAPTMMLSSAGLLIVVGVSLDTMKQLEAQLLMRHYEGFIK